MHGLQLQAWAAIAEHIWRGVHIFSILPVTVYWAERAFSSLKLVKKNKKKNQQQNNKKTKRKNKTKNPI